MTTSTTHWKNWPTSTRVFVGVGALVAVAVLAFLYTT
jgi:hypothetical protein